MLENILLGFAQLASWDVLLALVIGTAGGMIVGALPGFSAAMGVSLLIPLTYGMSGTAALVMLTAMYTSAIYGGSITAILCHTPGTPASAATAIDGFQLTKQGRGMEAMGVATMSSAIGGTISAVVMLLVNGSVAALAENVLTLPSAVRVIEEEAFEGDTSIDKVVLPEGVTAINARAFADSTLSEINLPASLESIDDSAFDGPDQVSV